ncbi:Growth factor receptor-bound protein 14 [Frankliniella fusca]|uniref:Growth factor receptor-bound protein 14 n=1 Tax=Frankliniella fusca TaxID=407009 RepID=A0AAE1LH04_9NEOP|nr:Growth factor receptor-bound protein 14 [Frankliniella fusca]
MEKTEKKNADKAPFSDPNDPRFDFLENDFLGFFEEWKRDILSRPGIFTDSYRSRMIVSHQALGAIQITVKSIVSAIRYMLSEAKAPSVGPRKFNQDPLEQYFSSVRKKQGDNRNPSLKAVLDTRLNIHAQSHVSVPSRKGNTEAEKRKDIEVVETPLLSKKVPRK